MYAHEVYSEQHLFEAFSLIEVVRHRLIDVVGAASSQDAVPTPDDLTRSASTVTAAMGSLGRAVSLLRRVEAALGEAKLRAR